MATKQKRKVTFRQIYDAVKPQDTEDQWTRSDKLMIARAVNAGNLSAEGVISAMDLTPACWSEDERVAIAKKLNL
jgi:hypothetical protein